jgi:exoribonuclease-2
MTTRTASRSSGPGLREGSLVLYKGRPARVAALADKIEITLPGGDAQRVRPKDVTLLHPGPLRSLADLQPLGGEVEAAWELLAGGTTTLAELADLAYGSWTPATAWAAWSLVADGLLFTGTPDAIEARSQEVVTAERVRREARAAEEQARAAFLARARAGTCAPEDARYLADVERLAEGRAEHSRVLQELGREESPESAHRFLLRVGHWNETVNPHPRRFGLTLDPPELEVPGLPDEPRVDLTALPAYAIDDEDNQDPDDALSLDGDRVWVHVADVAALVAPDSPLDREARARVANLYLPERTVPMLPAAVTERLGLGLQPVSPALSFGFQVTADGAPTSLAVARSWVRVTRISYAEADTRLEEEPFRSLYALVLRFQRRRLAAGAAQIALPEARVRVEAGAVTVRPIPRLRSRDLVTEAMLMAGEAAGRLAHENGIPFPFATQSGPDEGVPPPEGYAAGFAYRRLLKRSQMRTAPDLHAGLGLSVYSQVTSPLRRYLDLVAHQQLRAWLAGRPVLGHEEILERIGAVEALMGSLRQAERASNRHWTIVHLSRQPGWRGPGVLVDSRGGRGVVILPELALEAPVHLPQEVALDETLTLELSGFDLPSLSAYFNGSLPDG